jgi:hypothetical protein
LKAFEALRDGGVILHRKEEGLFIAVIFANNDSGRLTVDETAPPLKYHDSIRRAVSGAVSFSLSGISLGWLARGLVVGHLVGVSPECSKCWRRTQGD